MKNIKEVWKRGLCHGCGTCAGVCPNEAITMVESENGNFRPIINNSKCDNCHLCLRVCTGYSVDFNKLNNIIFGKIPDDILLGNFINCYIGHSTNLNIHLHGTSGGIVTELLLYALKQKIIDGAVVTIMDKIDPLRPKVMIATTSEEIVNAAKSKYCPVPLNIAIQEILKKEGRYAMVGLPCHIDSWRKAEGILPKLKERTVLHLGIFCSHNVSFKGTEFLLRKLNILPEQVAKIAYRDKGWPGGLSLRLKNGEEKFLPHGSYWAPLFGRFFFTPYSCTLCCDGLAELADISFGDAWLPEFRREKQGESILIVRTQMGKQLVDLAIAKNKVRLKEVESNKVLQSQRDQILFKKKNLITRMSFVNLLGKKVPDYKNTKFLKPTFWDKVTAIIPYINIKISNSVLGNLILMKIPLFILGYYGKLIQGLYNRSYGRYRNIKAKPIDIPPPKIMIINSYGPNIGDLSIIISMVNSIRKSFPKADYVIFSTNPTLASNYLNRVKFIKSLGSRSARKLFQIFNFLKFLIILFWLYFYQKGINLFFLVNKKTRKALYEYLDSDIIISCGGGYLNDFSGCAFLGCLFDIYLGIFLKKPVMLYAQSIGPFRKKIFRFISRYVLNRVNLITLRENKSLEFVKETGICKPPIYITADSALLLSSIPKYKARKILIREGIKNLSKPIITVTITPHMPWRNMAEREEKFSHYSVIVAKLIDYVIKQTDSVVLFIPMDIIFKEKKDNFNSESIISKTKYILKKKIIRNRSSFPNEAELLSNIINLVKNKNNIKILKGNYSPGEIKSIISLSEVHIATRMHSTIFASTTGVPVLAFAYEPKLYSFMKMLEQEQYIIDINNLNYEEIILKFDLLWRNRNIARKIILKRVEGLEQKASENIQLLSKILKAKKGISIKYSE